MKKDAYYFPHFSNARFDRKLLRVRKELGLEGYGIYFMLLEVLRDQIDYKYPLKDIDLLADEFGTSEQKVRTVVCNYGLFEVDKLQNFFSTKLILYLQPYLEKSEHAKKMAAIRWQNAKNQSVTGNAQAMPKHMPKHSAGYATKVNETKVNETKVNERGKPTLNDCINFFIQCKKTKEDGAKFFHHYASVDWKVGGQPVTDWASLAQKWILNSKQEQSHTW